MLARRYWLDGDGFPHREEVTLIPAPPGAPVVEPVGSVEYEGEAAPLVPLTVVAVVDPAVGDDALAGQPHVVYSAELPPGVRLCTREEYEAAVGQIEARRAASLAAREAEAAAVEETRRGALAKVAEAAGLTPEELAALTGSAS